MKSKLSFLSLGAILIIATAWTSPGYQYQMSAGDNNETAVSSRPVSNFSFFRTHRQGRGIAAAWGLNSEAGAVGFRVEKTYEDPTDPYAIWEQVEYVACNGSRSYKSADANVFPGNISYRVVAQQSDGSTVESAISTVRIVSHK
ncbi:MAG: hypothetical protein EOO94_01865 [Pedobacter sp.]|nr:MAG: hypothetical protein EOO94_01865 [Pedobacter sp.]